MHLPPRIMDAWGDLRAHWNLCSKLTMIKLEKMEKLEKIPPLKLQVKSPCPSTYAGKKSWKMASWACTIRGHHLDRTWASFLATNIFSTLFITASSSIKGFSSLPPEMHNVWLSTILFSNPNAPHHDRRAPIHDAVSNRKK